MQSVLPTSVNLKYWIYTLVGLFVITTLLVINLPHITKFIQFLRGWQDWYWGWLWEVIRNKRRQGPGDEEQEDSEDEGFEMGEEDGNRRNESGGGEV
jgi:hypothetical protein